MESPGLPSRRAFFLPPSHWGCLLGYSGLVPFVGLSAASCLLASPRQTWALFALVAYGATILSFLGAIHWGLALQDGAAPRANLLIWGVTPSLLAWVALLAGGSAALLIIVAGLWLCLAVDRRIYSRMGLGRWLGLRLVLTTLASLSSIVAAAVAAR